MKLMNNLNTHEAVVVGDNLIVSINSYGAKYVINKDPSLKINSKNSEVIINKKDKLYNHIPETTILDHYVLKDGTILSIQGCNKESNKYYDCELGENVYNSLEEKIEHIRLLDAIDNSTKKYKTIPEKFEEIEIKIIGEAVDPGSDNIHCAISLGEGKFETGGIFKLDKLNSVKEAVQEFAEENKFELTDIKRVEYCKIDNTYAFTSSEFRGLSVNYSPVFASLEDAKNAEKNIKDTVKDILKVKFSNKLLDGVLLKDVAKEISDIEALVKVLGVYIKDQENHRKIFYKISTLKKKLLKGLNK